MKRHIIGVFTSLAVAAILVSAQVSAESTPPQQEPKPVEVILTGCLIQGSGPTIFVLDKAKKNPTDRDEAGQSYVVVSKVEDMDLTKLVNHQLRITGTAEQKLTNPERQTERDLPRLTATAIVTVADTCPTPER